MRGRPGGGGIGALFFSLGTLSACAIPTATGDDKPRLRAVLEGFVLTESGTPVSGQEIAIRLVLKEEKEGRQVVREFFFRNASRPDGAYEVPLEVVPAGSPTWAQVEISSRSEKFVGYKATVSVFLFRADFSLPGTHSATLEQLFRWFPRLRGGMPHIRLDVFVKPAL